MDLDFLKNGAPRFAYELRKNFPEDESPVAHYIVDKGVIVISTKKLYVFFYERFIDYRGELLSTVEISNLNYDSLECSFKIENKMFDFVFYKTEDLKSLIGYYKKYKE